MKWTRILIVTLIAPFVFAETGQRETTSGWFLNPDTQNWSCNVFAGKTPIASGTGAGHCKAGDRAHLGYVYAQPVKVWDGSANKYYFYVEEWGQAEGPGSECPGDSVLIFEVPYTANGARASGVNPIYRGSASPCSSVEPHWLFSSAFYDPLTAGVTLTGQRNYSDGTAAAFVDIWIAESKPATNGSYGKHFTWKKLFATSIPGHNLFHLYVVPDADGRVWRGFIEHTAPGYGWGATPIIIDRAQNTIRYKSSATTWTTIPVGGSMTGSVPYIQYHGFFSAFVKVNNRYELWYDATGPRSGNLPMSPCDMAKYTYNVDGPLDRSGANIPQYIVVNTNLETVLGPLPLYSDTHPIPTDERFSVIVAKPANIVNLAGSTLYYGSNDWGVCNLYLTNWGHWSGSGIRYGRLTTQ
jgi:hypothetical protein